MNKEEYDQWVMAVVVAITQNVEPNEAFAKQVEAHDKEAAAHIRKCNKAGLDLAEYLAKKLEG